MPDRDVEHILDRRFDNGADFWAGPAGKVYVGNPFSTIAALSMLHELDVQSDHEAVAGGLELILAAGRDDGRIRLGPKSPMYPCYTAEAARVLCRFGLTGHATVRRAVDYFIDNVHEDGGWRCSFSKMGKGPETAFSNPGATLLVLDVMRHFDRFRGGDDVADNAVQTLLRHWTDRQPRGPCHWGIGTLFMQTEFPFLRYNLFFYVYVLSFYPVARDDPRFSEALAALAEKVDPDGGMVVERPHRALKDLEFCEKGRPSASASRRYAEIRENVAG